MKITQINISNFRGIKEASLDLTSHTVFVGDNNTGKSSILEAVDLVLGPERLSRYPIIDEHDFYAGEYVLKDESLRKIEVEVILIGLGTEQQSNFRNNIEWWDNEKRELIVSPPPESIDNETVESALRVKFIGQYEKEEDDFVGETFFSSPQNEDGTLVPFRKKDKRECGFLFLRTLRTGSRALSLERGSLLDMILRLQELRPQMWEDILNELRNIPIAENPALGISPILEAIQEGIRSYVPSEWAKDPHLRVSDLTRFHLRKLLTVFMDTGAKDEEGNSYAAPFQHQGTGTINTLVLTLLTMIADLKLNVIFAMEEPEIAIPPHTQKRIVTSVCEKSAQALFTSHSPYVLEEFNPANILSVNKVDGALSGTAAGYPPAVKPKKYKEEFKRRFCETLLSRRVLITEGRTEYDSFIAASRKLALLDSEKFSSLGALGISLINAETDSQVAPLGEFFRGLGKEVFAVFDKQRPEQLALIDANVDHAFESPEDGFEKLILDHTGEDALVRFALSLVNTGEWPPHLAAQTPTANSSTDDTISALGDYLKWAKGQGTCADLLAQCSVEEMPSYVTETMESIKSLIESENDAGADDEIIEEVNV